MRSFLKKIIYPVLKPIVDLYLRKPQRYRSRGLVLKIAPSVFHPGLYLSTNILADFALKQALKDKKVLELGAGSGFVSLLLAREGARLTASDVNPKALEMLRFNARENHLELEVVEADLFSSLSPNDFDCILINPPYYPRTPENMTETAFFCGEDFEYFRRLFAQIAEQWTRQDAHIYIILSEDCALEQITQLLHEKGLKWQEVHRLRKRREWNFIYQLEKPA